jgi:excisionase family DNA binding protein
VSSKPGWGRIKAIAEYTDSGPRTVRKYLKRGLPHVRIPGSGTILIKFSDVDEWLKQFACTEDEIDKIVGSVLKGFGAEE